MECKPHVFWSRLPASRRFLAAVAAPRTSSEALNNATLPFGLALADHGLNALKRDPHLARGLNVLKGQITYPAVAEAQGLDWSDPFGVWRGGRWSGK